MSARYFDKHGLTQTAMKAAVKARSRAKLDQISPICIFDVCESLGVTVRSTDINMEGMYSAGKPPRILISSQRPLVRRVFTCGHELGHHEFGHGTTIDEMTEEAAALKAESPDEFLVNAFSGFILMPVVGLRGAFARRKLQIAQAQPKDILAVANNFGVGYATLVSHLAYTLQELPSHRARELLRSSPKAIRRTLIGDDSAEPLVIVDGHWAGKPVDVEVGTSILLPPGSSHDGAALKLVGECAGGIVVEAVRPGIGRVLVADHAIHFVRVARKAYVGLARYRHMEDDDV
jgi:Zn-dependent peptidase ImmA (M78 family)